MSISTELKFDWEWDKRERECIAHGALTNSKRPSCLVRGVYPTHLKRGLGCYVWDTNGKKYIDFICGLGCNILGYANDQVNRAVIDQLDLGCTLSLATTLEVECAEKLKSIFPFIERLRFLKTGSDACSAAVRIARTKTNRAHVWSEGYHGFHDDFVSLTPPALGVFPKQRDMFLLSAKKPLPDFSNTAAVIIEPIITDHSPERIDWLQKLMKEAKNAGALVIFDEVITGFRYPKMSASNYYGLQPDLICLGKAMANGLPVSVVGGKKEIMECGEYFVSSTFAGETLSLAAALATINLLQNDKYDLTYLWNKGEQFQREFNRLAPSIVKIEGYPTRGVLVGEDLKKALFMQEACKAGMLFGPSFFFNFKHIEIMDLVLSSCKDIMTKIEMGGVQLEGELPASPFSQKLREAS